MTRSPEAVARMQTCLAFEHEAVWLYAYLGARVPDVAKAARTSFSRHRHLRDELLSVLHAWAASNPLPRADYAVATVLTTAQAEAAARAVESRSAAAWLSVIAVADQSDRSLALARLRTAALAELKWGGKPEPFPGLRP